MFKREGMEMVKKGKDEYCCAPMESGMGCCKVESLISVDERGQMVLPKEIRDKAKIRAGDKLAVVAWERDGEVCCISLVKVEGITEMVKDMLGPMMKEIIKD
jgi:antitoxin PrlF